MEQASANVSKLFRLPLAPNSSSSYALPDLDRVEPIGGFWSHSDTWEFGGCGAGGSVRMVHEDELRRCLPGHVAQRSPTLRSREPGAGMFGLS
jgi:hypothetical protein